MQSAPISGTAGFVDVSTRVGAQNRSRYDLRKRPPTTSNPSAHSLKAARISESSVTAESAVNEQVGIESLVFPNWMGDDPATEGPNYLGYSTVLMPVSLLVALVILAAIVAS